MIKLGKIIKKGLYEQIAIDKYIWLKTQYNKTLTNTIIQNFKKHCDITLETI